MIRHNSLFLQISESFIQIEWAVTKYDSFKDLRAPVSDSIFFKVDEIPLNWSFVY